MLLGATGTGKSATTAWLIEPVQRPTLVLAHNKTLAAQLANEFRELMPNNAVEYFVSYYDYYQPEAYVPQTDTFIEKDSSINAEVERLRHSTTNSLLSRRDVIVVCTVSCIYGLGAPEEYLRAMVALQVGERYDRDALIRKFIAMQYNRNDVDFSRGNFRVRGDTIEIIPVYEEYAIRIEMFGDEIEALYMLHPLTGDVVQRLDSVPIFPASHYVAGTETVQRAIGTIEHELEERLKELESQNKLLEAQRLRMRTTFDLEMLQQLGFCSGIENYSRHLDGRAPGEPPHTLLDFFPDDFLMVIDESHVTVPQIGAMYEGDASRKRTLVEHGFRLPSALDNRPLRWDEFKNRVGQTVYLSATPGRYEMGIADGVVEQIIRPTGLVDPQIVVKPSKGQIDDLLEEIRVRAARDERVLVTTLTKKMAEELTDFLGEHGVRVRYLHSDVDTLRRVELLSELRAGVYDVLVGINLLREGLDLPEVSLVVDPRRRQGGLPAHRARRSSRRSAARPATSRARCTCTPTRSPTRCARRSTRPTGAARSRSPTTSSERHRPAAAAQAHRRHHRGARARGIRHRRRCCRARRGEARSPARASRPTPRLRREGIAAEGAEQLEATIADLSRPDARRGRRAQVRARRATARRGAGPQEGAARHGARRSRLSGRIRGARCAHGQCMSGFGPRRSKVCAVMGSPQSGQARSARCSAVGGGVVS